MVTTNVDFMPSRYWSDIQMSFEWRNFSFPYWANIVITLHAHVVGKQDRANIVEMSHTDMYRLAILGQHRGNVTCRHVSASNIEPTDM